MGLVGGLQGNLQNPNANRPAPSAPTQPQQDAHMSTPEEAKSGESATGQRVNLEERKERAELRQESLNNNFVNSLNFIASSGDNPLSNMMQNFLPAFSSAMSNSPGGNPMAQSFRTLFPSDAEGEPSFFRNVMLDCSTQEFIALFSGNYEILTNMHPRTKNILLKDYMDGVDNKENRSKAADKISKELNSQIFVPEDLQANIVGGANPVEVVSTVNRKYVEKLINTILDIECDSGDNTVFLKRVKRNARWWLGEAIDSLKPLFTNSLQDVLKMFRANIQGSIQTNIDDSSGILSGMFTDTIMQSITSNYNEYVNEKQREDQLEANDKVTISESRKQRDQEINSKMEVDEEPKIEEEPLRTTVTTHAHAQVHTQPPQPAVVKREEAPRTQTNQQPMEDEEQDPEIKQLLDQMDEDQSMLVVDPPNRNPRSRAYKALDGYYQNNIESGNSITETPRSKLTAKQSLTNMLKNALKESGVSPDNAEKMMKDKEVSDEFVDHYKEVVKEEIRERKKGSDFEKGRFPELDRI